MPSNVYQDATPWTGFYIGAFAGINATKADVTTNYKLNNSSDYIPDQTIKTSSPTFGGFIGYNYQINSFVVGAESEFNLENIKANKQLSDITLKATPNYNTQVEIKNLYSSRLRLRLGYEVIPQFLLYATAGGSIADEKVRLSLLGATLDNFSDASLSKTHLGWNIGLGGEYAFTQNINMRLEYVHDKFGSKQYLFRSISSWRNRLADMDNDTIRTGVSYKF